MIQFYICICVFTFFSIICYWKILNIVPVLYIMFLLFILYIIVYICGEVNEWHPTPVLRPRKIHGWRSLEGCSPWGR